MTAKKDLGATVKAATSANVLLGNVPITAGAATRTSAGIDRLGYDTCLLIASTGAETGSPTGRTLDASLEHSDESGSGFTAFTGSDVTQITAVNITQVKSIDLSGAKRYIRVVEIATLTAGSTPTIGKSSQVILGGAATLPAV
jgi:hypothetical protein